MLSFLLRKESNQRFALAAGGRDERKLEEQKKPEGRKRLKKPQNPTRPLHALLAAFLPYKT